MFALVLEADIILPREDGQIVDRQDTVFILSLQNIGTRRTSYLHVNRICAYTVQKNTIL